MQIQISQCALISQIPYLLTKYLLGLLIHCESKVRIVERVKNLIVNKTQHYCEYDITIFTSIVTY